MIWLLIAADLAAGQPQPITNPDPHHRLIERIATDGRTIWRSSGPASSCRGRTESRFAASMPINGERG